ncbi:CLUMA_CG010374, isoform A [Clunio marinus]|uniref:CLUMA_CG010374, isoform A n=1 Tax=Clunio marinus TaxID=568069 RepID=A0A1J1I9M3_9DIPT|nr:CLUMA_CG010374, isoform A [Clunio marinus]
MSGSSMTFTKRSPFSLESLKELLRCTLKTNDLLIKKSLLEKCFVLNDIWQANLLQARLKHRSFSVE